MEYQIVSTVIDHPEEGKTKAYGIKAISSDGAVCVIADVSARKEAVEALVALCNQMQLEPCHLKDVVEDFLA